MDTRKIFLTAILLVVVFFPQSSSAYEATKQSAFKLDDRTYLFLIEYEFGFLNADTWLPLAAVKVPSTQTITAGPSQISYYISGLAGTTTVDRSVTATNIPAWRSHSVVLSSAQVVDVADEKYYFVPKRERHTFTLVTILRADKPLPADTDRALKLQVTALPYTVEREDRPGRSTHLVSPQSLAGYRTPAPLLP